MRWTTGGGRPAHLAFAFLVATLAPDPAFGQAPANPAAPHPPVITHHVGTFNGKQVSYTATVEGIDVPDVRGKPAARVVSFAYVADNMGDPSTRPVLFAFNGGPITASIWLHLGILGPKRVAVPDDLAAGPASYQLVDNTYSPLDATDLVLIDLASTGYSRVLPGTPPQSYYSVVADGQQITAFISAWLGRHDRLSSPVYLLGESYGTMRAAEVAAQLAELPHPILVDGVIPLGQALNIIEFSQRPQNILSYVVSLSTLAATACYHGKVAAGCTPAKQVAEANKFASDFYLKALYVGSELLAAERDTIVARLAGLTGLSPAFISQNNLRISASAFAHELLRDQNEEIGLYDSRFTLPLAPTGNDPVADDPAMGQYVPAFVAAYNIYARHELSVSIDDTYQAIAFRSVNLRWDYGRGPGAGPRGDYARDLAVAMRRNPQLRLVVGEGYYDLVTPLGSAAYAISHAGFPPDRTSLRRTAAVSRHCKQTATRPAAGKNDAIAMHRPERIAGDAPIRKARPSVALAVVDPHVGAGILHGRCRYPVAAGRKTQILESTYLAQMRLGRTLGVHAPQTEVRLHAGRQVEQRAGRRQSIVSGAISRVQSYALEQRNGRPGDLKPAGIKWRPHQRVAARKHKVSRREISGVGPLVDLHHPPASQQRIGLDLIVRCQAGSAGSGEEHRLAARKNLRPGEACHPLSAAGLPHDLRSPAAFGYALDLRGACWSVINVTVISPGSAGVR